MEKKNYIAPSIIIIKSETDCPLMVTSKDDGKKVEAIGDFEFVKEADGDDNLREGDACAKLFHQYDAWADLPSY